MRILVTGSRDWADVETIRDYLLLYSGGKGTVLVHGGCPTGADKIAHDIASGWPWTIEVHHANWKKHGKAAGPLRNAEMVELGADVVLAFPMGESRGTRNCIELAREAALRVVVVEARDPKGDNHGDEDYDKL